MYFLKGGENIVEQHVLPWGDLTLPSGDSDSDAKVCYLSVCQETQGLQLQFLL
jgi:hypothetical protein